MIELLQQPFVQIGLLVALVLAGIHAYLGFHVVSRGVIFVDLYLAQTEAFGYPLVGLPSRPLDYTCVGRPSSVGHVGVQIL